MQTYTIEISALSADTIRRLDRRARAKGENRSEHVRKLIEKDLALDDSSVSTSIDESLAAIRQGFTESGQTEDETLSLLTKGLKATRAEKKAVRA